MASVGGESTKKGKDQITNGKIYLKDLRSQSREIQKCSEIPLSLPVHFFPCLLSYLQDIHGGGNYFSFILVTLSSWHRLWHLEGAQ